MASGRRIWSTSFSTPHAIVRKVRLNDGVFPQRERYGCLLIGLWVFLVVSAVTYAMPSWIFWADFWRAYGWTEVPVRSAEGGSKPGHSCGPRCYVPGESWCDFEYVFRGERHSARQADLSTDEEAACKWMGSAWVNPSDPGEAIVFREPTDVRFFGLLLWNAMFGLVVASVIADRLRDKRLTRLQWRRAEHSTEQWLWWPEWERGAVASVPSWAPFRLTMALFLLPVPVQAFALFLVDGTIVSFGALTWVAIATIAGFLLVWPSLRRFLMGVRSGGVWQFHEEPLASAQEPVRLRPGYRYRGRLLLERGWLAGLPLHLVVRLRCEPIVQQRSFSSSVAHEQKHPIDLRLTREGFAGDLSLELPRGVNSRPLNIWTLTVETPRGGVIARFDLPVYAE